MSLKCVFLKVRPQQKKTNKLNNDLLMKYLQQHYSYFPSEKNKSETENKKYLPSNLHNH